VNPIDPLAILTAKPQPITKAEAAAAQHAQQAYERRGKYLAHMVRMADPQHNPEGPQIRLRRGSYRFVAHGNPRDLYNRW
jgi:hypothetical protein